MKGALKLVTIGLLIFVLAGCAAAPAATTAPAAPTTAPAAPTAAPIEPTVAPAPTTAPTAAAAVAAGKPIKMGFSAINLADAIMANFATQLKAEASKYNVTLTLSDCGGDPSKQINDVENMIAAGNDVIVIQALNPEGMDPLVKEAQGKGIKVIAYGIGLNTYDAWYKNDNYKVGQGIGEMAAKWINANAGGKANVALIEFPVVPVLVDRAKGIEDALKAGSPNATIVARGSAIDSENGMKLMETFLQKNPDIKVVVSISDGPALGAYEAVKSAGLDNKDFAIFGSDLAPQAVQYIAEGTAYRGTIDTDNKVSFDNTLQMARDLVDGKLTEKIKVMGVIQVTIDNIADYK